MAIESTASGLQTCPHCGASIDTSNAEPLANVDCPSCGEKVRAERTFNNFLIVETVGVGGMGTVYKARDTLLDRFVALKLLRKDLEGGLDATAELRREARSAASVNHPNIVQVFSSGTDHDQFYLVMELVEHGSLDDLIEERARLSEEQVLEAGIHTAKGLRAAYAKGLMHRDVKPANILFADDRLAKIGDFGLAGITAEARGEIWGTPYYVAPERLQSQPEDFRSDIYSLGATLFHALAGRAPIEGDTNSASELLALKQQPLLLSVVAPEVSPDTARILQRMIAPNPAQRFSSYDELVTELEAAYKKLTGRDMIDVATAKRKTRKIVIAAAAVLLLVGIGVFVYVQKTEQKIAVSSTAIPVAELEKQAADARHQLVLNHYNVAGNAFAHIANEARGRQPIQDWAKMQQGLAAMVGRDDASARESFAAVEKAGTKGFAKEDLDLANFFMTASKTLLASRSVSASETKKDANLFNAFGLFPFALKDISQLDVKNAEGLLDGFTKSQPIGKFAWIAELKPLAQKYLDDCRLYLEWKSQPDAPAPDKKQLKIQRSAIADAVLGKVTAPAPVTAPVVEAPPPPPARQLTQKELQDAAQKKPQWLAAWRKKLIDDLDRRQFNGAFTDTSGTEYTGISSADNQAVGLKLPYGIARLPWNKLAPQTLLKISASFIQPNAPDAADRQWLCAVYASSTGQTDEARQLAESAGQSKPEYRDQIDALFAPIKRPIRPGDCSLRCMRRWVYPAFFVVVVTLYAAPLPLTVSEIGLMLRTGYSSETMMQELSKRHFADRLDETKEQALIKAGASAELIDKLKSGIYSLSAEKIAAIQEQMAVEAQHRAEQAAAARKSDAAYQAEVAKKRSDKSPPLNTGGTLAISEFLKHDLVQIKNGSPAHADETALESKRLIALYFSAEWCGPCRKFTPQLVDYYKRVAPEHPEFEVVFYSSDRSQFAMEKYMRDENMPWLAIDFAKLKDKEVLKKNAGNGIPSLVLVDESGNVISSSYVDGKFRGPQQVLADLDAIFAGKAPGRLVSAQ